MATLIEQLASNIIDTKFETFSDEVIDAAKKRVLDVVGCIIGGANAPGNAKLLDLLREWGGARQATILLHGDKVPLPHAAMMNSLMARSFDFEACGPEPEGANAGKMVGHIPSTTEPTALSVGEYRKSTGKEMIAAVVLGGDMAARISVSDDFSFHTCFELCGTANAFGATALTGRLYGLTVPEMVNAFGLLMNQMAGTFQNLWDGVEAFKLPGALSARNGVMSVELAKRGFTAMKDPLLSLRGYFNQYCKNPHPEYMLRDLGKVFYVKAQHKMHPSCYGNHNPIECTLEIVRKNEYNPEDIASVTLDVPFFTYNRFLNQPFVAGDSQQKALFNIPYGVASALLRKAERIEYYTDEFIADPKVIEMATKVTLVATLPDDNTHAVRMTVRMKDGREFSAYRDYPKGWLKDPASMGEIKGKFWRNVEFAGTVPKKNSEEAIAMIEHLEDIEDVSIIAQLLVS
jgi:2-methylcitrate dehydratase PrpD